MRYPEFLKDRGTIGFVAPSMGCTTEPYRSAFDNAIKRFHSMGYKTIEGPNCRCDSGIGISNTPKKCAEELNESYASVDSDVDRKSTRLNSSHGAKSRMPSSA